MKTPTILAALAAALFLPGAAQTADSQASFAYTPGPAGGATLTLNGNTVLTATQRGWITATGVNNGGGVDGNYLVGRCGSSDNCVGDDILRRNYFSFDLAGVGTINSAALGLVQPEDAFGFPTFDGYISVTPTLGYALYDYTGASPVQTATGTGVYGDLGDGNSFGSVVLDASTIGTTVQISFNAAGLAALNAANGSFAFGGATDALAAPGGGVPEPASWAMMIVGLGGTGGMLRRRRTTRLQFLQA